MKPALPLFRRPFTGMASADAVCSILVFFLLFSFAVPGLAESLTLNGDGSGVLTLGGTNTYGGGTIVNSGTLVLNGASSLLAGSSLTIGTPGPGAVFSPPAVSTPAGNAGASLAPVPEPGTFVLLAIAAVAGLGIWRKRVMGRG